MLRGKGGRPGSDARLIPLTVPEVRRLITRLVWTVHHPADFVLSWSQWRRRHQARAQRSHYQRRLSLGTSSAAVVLGCVDILVMMLVCQMLSCQQNSGTGFSISCVAAPACMSLRKKIASDLSRLCCGLTAPAPNGGCFRPNTGIGTVSINDSPVGLTKASGNRCFNISPATRTWNT